MPSCLDVQRHGQVKSISRICDDNQLLISFRCSQDPDQSTGLMGRGGKTLAEEFIILALLMPELRLRSSSVLSRTPGIECLSVIIVVIISKEWVVATKQPPRLTFTGFRGRLIYTLVTLHPNFHILATVLCASQNCLACNLSLSS